MTVLNPAADCTVTVSPATVGIAEVEPTLHKIVTATSLHFGDPCVGKQVICRSQVRKVFDRFYLVHPCPPASISAP